MFHSSSICLASSLVDVKLKLKLGDKHKLESESSGCESLKKPAKKPKKPSNPYGRMREPEGGVAAVVVTKKNGELLFSQYQTPTLLDNPKLFRTLVIEQDTSTSTSPTKTPFGDLRLKVYTPEGKTIHNCKRFYDMVNNGEASAVLFFSPAKDKTGKDREVQIVRHETNLKPMVLSTAFAELNNEMPIFENTEGQIKGKGQIYTIPSTKAHERSKLTGNKKVWDYESAEEVMFDFIEKNKDKTDVKQLAILKKLVTLFKVEWTHLLGVSLSSKEFNPQTQANMGAGFKVLNTWMMVLEDLAAYFSFNDLGVVTVKPEFTMLEDSQIIEKIYYSVTIKRGEREVGFSATKPALALPNRSNFPSTTDKNVLRELANAFLDGTEPTRTDSFALPKKPRFSGFMEMVCKLASDSLKKCDCFGLRA